MRAQLRALRGMTPELLRQLITDNTTLTRPPLCPELETFEVRDLVLLWEKMESIEGSQVEPPFWACCWPGGQALARYVLDHPALVSGRVVLDLGCGNGLASLACARAGARRVLACDTDPSACWTTLLHAERNAVSLETVGDDLLEKAPPVPPVEVVLAGDMFYARELSARAEPWLRAAAAAGAEVLLGDPGRRYLPSEGLEPLACYEVAVSPDIESVSSRTVRVHRISAGGASFARG